jgi:hypothetical protein
MPFCLLKLTAETAEFAEKSILRSLGVLGELGGDVIFSCS